MDEPTLLDESEPERQGRGEEEERKRKDRRLSPQVCVRHATLFMH